MVLFCFVIITVGQLWLSLIPKPLFSGGWWYGHSASSRPGKDLCRKRQDFHWNQQQAGETRQCFVYPFSSCCHIHTCDYVSHNPYVFIATKPPVCYVCTRTHYIILKENACLVHNCDEHAQKIKSQQTLELCIDQNLCVCVFTNNGLTKVAVATSRHIKEANCMYVQCVWL